VDVEPSLFEADILPVSNPDEPSADNLREKRNAVRLRRYIWKSKIIPYAISSELRKFLVSIYAFYLFTEVVSYLHIGGKMTRGFVIFED